MVPAQCQCGARYQLPETAAGKRARCKKCGQVFAVAAPEPADEGVIPFGDLDALAGGTALERPRPAEALPLAETASEHAAETLAYAGPEDLAGSPARGLFSAYLRALVKNLAFPFASTGNLITFFILWFVLIVGLIVRFAPVFGFFAAFIIQGWYLAFQLNTVLSGAANDEDLPELSLSGSWIDDIIAPFFKMLLTYMLARLPALIFLLSISAAGLSGTEITIVSLGFLFGNNEFLFGQTSDNILAGVLLLGVGYLLWPMFVLVTAVGGVAGLVRVDLIGVTIMKTLPGYLLAALAALAGLAIQLGLGIALALLGVGLTSKKADFSSFLIWPPLFAGIELFVVIVMMRAIGLYYHHYKSRFAWSWG